MLLTSVLSSLLLPAAVARAAAVFNAGEAGDIAGRTTPLQDIVTWDSHSIFIRGERLMFFSGEFHPFRLPAPGLWLDVFQKIKALGFNGASFYVDWALLEGKQGLFTAEGVFALEPFFAAAQTAGIYLLARPGPYINAEVSGGGFPGWLSRNPAPLRTADPGYLNATDNYVSSIGSIIAKAQITNGGPVVLVQPENEYSQGNPPFPDPNYFGYVENQYRSAGIVVPLMSNDNSPHGYFAPGPPAQQAAVDIYGHDSYAIGFDDNTYEWPEGGLPTSFYATHESQSSSSPYAIPELQGGSWDPWGGYGYNKTALRLGVEYERIFYKNLYAAGVAILNTYMAYGGTNFGNLGYPQGYTDYDYGAAISEPGRGIWREKYSELKLQANFIQASPDYLTATPQDNSNMNGAFTGNSDLATTAVLGNTTGFYIVRHADYTSMDSTQYTISLPTSAGNFTIPQLSGSLTLNGRDSKVHVTDYNVGGTNLVYSSAEIFTWKKYGDKTVLVVYGGPGETHELAIAGTSQLSLIEGNQSEIQNSTQNNATIINFSATSTRKIAKLGDNFYLYMLDRYSAYGYWVVSLPNDPVSGNHTNATHFQSTPIVKGPYLLRTLEASGSDVHLTGDLNATANIEVIGAGASVKTLTFNGKSLKFQQDDEGVVKATASFKGAKYSLPDLSSADWRTIDSLPEIRNKYKDSAWTAANHNTSNNPVRPITTAYSLYAPDYGYNTGYLIYRGYFTAKGGESLTLLTQGGAAYGYSIWLNGTFVGSFDGQIVAENFNGTYSLPGIKSGKVYVITLLMDQTGFEENGIAGYDQMKSPRGIMDFNLTGHAQTDVHWKVTGNLGGEDYRDQTRGPLNEGGLYAERQGFHLPGAPAQSWGKGSPMDGIDQPGVAFYATTFNLNMPKGYDIPISVSLSNTTNTTTSYRCQIYVNGYQFGKYTHNIGPQGLFPVPQGIWNYQGSNYLAISLWALEKGGAKVENLQLVAAPSIQWGYGDVELSPLTKWSKRAGAY